MSLFSKPTSAHAAFGWCNKCQVEHSLQEGNAPQHAVELMRELEESKRIDYLVPEEEADPKFSTDYLFGEARGQMFGILECENHEGQTVILRSFSGQYHGIWHVDGWAPPLFNVAAHNDIMIPGDREIKQLGRNIKSLERDKEEIALLKRQRKQLSQSIMKKLHNLYVLHNFCGEVMPLAEFFKHVQGIPTGAGDCCAPKLLNLAARKNLRPLGITEFFWGKTNRSATCKHSQFYSSCASRCQPILGFMLCGVSR